MASVADFADSISTIASLPVKDYWKDFSKHLEDNTQISAELQQDMFDGLKKSISDIGETQVDLTKDVVKSVGNSAVALQDSNMHLKDIDQDNDSEATYKTKSLYLFNEMAHSLDELVAGSKKLKTKVIPKKEEDKDVGLALPALIAAWFGKKFSKMAGKAVDTFFKGLSSLFKMFKNFFTRPKALLATMFSMKKARQIMAPLEKVWNLIAKPFKVLRGGIFKLIKPIWKIAKPFMKLAKGLGRASIYLAPVIATIDGVIGWFKASEISGISEDKLTLFDKAMSAISAFLTSLIFGIPDAVLSIIGLFGFTSLEKKLRGWWEKTIPVVTEQGMFKFLNGIVDFVTRLFQGDFSDITKIWDSLGKQITAIPSLLMDKVSGLISSIMDFIKNIDFSSILKSASSVISNPLGFLADKILGSSSSGSIASPVTGQGVSTTKNMKEAFMTKPTPPPPPQVVVQQIPMQAPTESGRTVLGLGDYGMQLINSGGL